MEFNELQIVIIISSIVLFTVLVIAILLFSLFQKKKLYFILREKEQEKQFEETLTKSQIEIRENALKNIAWELHDNVGQLLSLARMELNILRPNVVGENTKKVEEISEIIGDSIQDIRSLSKTLNSEVIKNMGLVQSIQVEIDRFNRLKFIEASFVIKGETYDIPQKDQIILFRMIQEFLSNTIKHSKATALDVLVNYLKDSVEITTLDNGRGFDFETVKKGSGLINIKSRAALIETELIYKSDESGTQMKLIYPVRKT